METRSPERHPHRVELIDIVFQDNVAMRNPGKSSSMTYPVYQVLVQTDVTYTTCKVA